MSRIDRIPFDGQAIGVIPARMASTRFPNKPLALIHKVPLICWTLKRAGLAKSLKQVFVAAEDEAIVAAIREQGGEARLVQGDFQCGSERVAAAVRGLEASVVVNIQADEPLISAAIIDAAIAQLEARPEFGVTTAVRSLRSVAEYRDANCVKAVLDKHGRCLYFSRAPIPALKDHADPDHLPSEFPFKKHIGLYCFRRVVLNKFSELPASDLEQAEGLEQLRLLEYGAAIGAIETSEFSPAIDAPADLLALERYLDEHQIHYA